MSPHITQVIMFVILFPLAARFDQVSVVVWLIESEESSPVEKAKNGITPLHLAAARGSLNVVRWLSQNALRLNKYSLNYYTIIIIIIMIIIVLSIEGQIMVPLQYILLHRKDI